MSIKNSGDRPKNRRVKLVGGGFRHTGGEAKSGSAVKAMRRALRERIKDKRNITPEQRRALRAQLQELLRSKK